MPVEHKPGKSKKITHPIRKKRTHTSKPLPILPLAIAPDLPLPTSPVEPAAAPPPPVLVKTTYNRRRFWQVGSIMLIVVIVGLAYTAYLQRSYWLPLVQPTPASKVVYRLQVSPEKLDTAKAQSILQQVNQTASGSASPTSPASTGIVGPQVPSAEILATYTSDQLQSLLQQQINQLQSEKQDVRTLQSYLVRAQAQPQKATDILKEGVQLAKEFQALYLYYRK